MSRAALATGLLGLALGMSAPAGASTPCRSGGKSGVKFESIASLQFDNANEIPVAQSEGRLDRVGNRLIFTQPEVRLWVEAKPPGWHESFRIGGLINPEIQLVRGAVLKVTVLNLDWNTPINFEVVNCGPPFEPEPIEPDPWRSGRRAHYIRNCRGHMVPMVTPRCDSIVYGAQLVFKFETAGEYSYVVTSRGAANGGNYGRIRVVP